MITHAVFKERVAAMVFEALEQLEGKKRAQEDWFEEFQELLEELNMEYVDADQIG